MQDASLSEKSFWDILPSPERSMLCDKIGFSTDVSFTSIGKFQIITYTLICYNQVLCMVAKQ